VFPPSFQLLFSCNRFHCPRTPPTYGKPGVVVLSSSALRWRRIVFFWFVFFFFSVFCCFGLYLGFFFFPVFFFFSFFFLFVFFLFFFLGSNSALFSGLAGHFRSFYLYCRSFCLSHKRNPLPCGLPHGARPACLGQSITDTFFPGTSPIWIRSFPTYSYYILPKPRPLDSPQLAFFSGLSITMSSLLFFS